MKIQVHNVETFKKKMKQYCIKHNINIIDLDKTKKEPLYILVPQEMKPEKPNILIAAGFHGDEPSGPWSILFFINKYIDKYKNDINIFFLPLINLTGFKYDEREDIRGDNPNRKFKAKNEKGLSREGSLLKDNINMISSFASDGFLSLHEDPDKKTAYLFCYERNNLVSKIKDAMVKYFKISTDEELKKTKSYSKGSYKDGAI